MFQDMMKLSGELDILLLDKDGNIKDSRKETNLVVNAGLTFICSRMAGTTPAVMSHMALGTDSTAEAAGNTALGSQSGLRKGLTSTTPSSNTITYVASFGDGEGLTNETVAGNGTATTAVTEAGIFNAGTAGTMLCRTTFPVVNKADGDTLQITWTITLNAA
jgi:hypothetical protein